MSGHTDIAEALRALIIAVISSAIVVGMAIGAAIVLLVT